MDRDEWVKAHVTNANGFAIEAVKAFLLLNGGAAVALMTLIGATSGKDIVAWSVNIDAGKNAIRWFGGGAMAAGFSAAAFYSAELLYAAQREGGIAIQWPGTMRAIAVLILMSSALAFVLELNNAAAILSVKAN